MRTFINHTNHAAKFWSRSQRTAAERYGEIVDVPFPAIPASAETTEVTELALQTGRELLRMEPAAVVWQCGRQQGSPVYIPVCHVPHVSALGADQ